MYGVPFVPFFNPMTPVPMPVQTPADNEVQNDPPF